MLVLQKPKIALFEENPTGSLRSCFLRVYRCLGRLVSKSRVACVDQCFSYLYIYIYNSARYLEYGIGIVTIFIGHQELKQKTTYIESDKFIHRIFFPILKILLGTQRIQQLPHETNAVYTSDGDRRDWRGGSSDILCILFFLVQHRNRNFE